jgi:hypothetical protein
MIGKQSGNKNPLAFGGKKKSCVDRDRFSHGSEMGRCKIFASNESQKKKWTKQFGLEMNIVLYTDEDHNRFS